MKYTVVLTGIFHAKLEEHIDYLLEQGAAPHVIAAWRDRLFARLRKLDEMPGRFPIDQVQSKATGREARKLNFGEYVAFYYVDDERQRVEVGAFMHGSMRREI